MADVVFVTGNQKKADYLSKYLGYPVEHIKLDLDEICSLVDGKDRSAVARCVFGYYDGETEVYFEGHINGSVPEKPSGTGGMGFDPMFIPEGYSVTRAELNEEDDRITYTTMKPFAKVKEFLEEK